MFGLLEKLKINLYKHLNIIKIRSLNLFRIWLIIYKDKIDIVNGWTFFNFIMSFLKYNKNYQNGCALNKLKHYFRLIE
jgi:hypothetical protein